MELIPLLKYGAIVSLLIALVSLSIQVLKTFSFGKKKLYAEPKGNVGKGIIYAMGKAMMPWEKESAKNHLPTYIGGILYHGSIFLSLLYFLLTLFSVTLPHPAHLFFQFFFLTGIVSGTALLCKRIISGKMRNLSCPDDYAANILVDLFMVSALLHSLFPVIAPVFYLLAILLFLYMPVGKIRHCFFFFYVRILYGLFYGRRNIFPNKQTSSQSS